ncbi:hypothetical protein D3C86_1465090 [compost metagenome]
MLTVTYDHHGIHVGVEPKAQYTNHPSSPGQLQQVQRIDDAEPSQDAVILAVVAATVRGGDAFGYAGFEYGEELIDKLAWNSRGQEDLLLALLAPQSTRGAAFISRAKDLVEATARGHK